MSEHHMTKASSQDYREFIFSYSGNSYNLISKLNEFMSPLDSQIFLSNIHKLHEYLGSEEYINITSVYSKSKSGMMCFIVPSTDYNITALTLMAIATALDIRLKLGFVASSLAIIGFSGQAIVKLDVNAGEKCLVYEAMKNPKHIVGENIFLKNHGQCIHNNLPCKHRNNNSCTFSKQEIINTLSGLCNKNVFRKEGTSFKYDADSAGYDIFLKLLMKNTGHTNNVISNVFQENVYAAPMALLLFFHCLFSTEYLLYGKQTSNTHPYPMDRIDNLLDISQKPEQDINTRDGNIVLHCYWDAMDYYISELDLKIKNHKLDDIIKKEKQS